jgi:hypothetical protein
MQDRPRLPQTVMAMIVLLATVALLVSCGSSTSTTVVVATTVASTTFTTVPATTSSSTSSTAPATTTAMSAEDAQAVRDLAFLFWEAYNAYEPDRAVALLDESYRPAKEKIVRDEIGRVKTFGVTLGMSEKTAPVLTGPDQAEMYLSLKEPLGTRTIWMKFARRGEAWTITYTEEAQ